MTQALPEAYRLFNEWCCLRKDKDENAIFPILVLFPQPEDGKGAWLIQTPEGDADGFNYQDLTQTLKSFLEEEKSLVK